MKIRRSRASWFSIEYLDSVGQAIAGGGKCDTGDQGDEDARRGAERAGKAEADGFDHPGGKGRKPTEESHGHQAGLASQLFDADGHAKEEGAGEIDSQGSDRIVRAAGSLC